jgi:hypothetical protein
MARQYAKVLLTIWNDPDFKSLSINAQWLYFTMLTYPTLNSCGVLEWREAKLAKMANGIDVATLRAAAWELGERRLIAVDPDTEEALVRSFVRHDGALKSPNLVKAMVREHGAIASQKIMALVSREVRRAISEHPEYSGARLAEPIVKQFPEPFQLGSDFVPDWFHLGSVLDPLKNGEPFQLGSISVPLSLNPQPLSKDKRGEPEQAPDPAPRRTRFPDGWTPKDSHRVKAQELNLDLDWEARHFEDNAIAKGVMYVDWDRAFFSWMTKSVEFGRTRRSTSREELAWDRVPTVTPGKHLDDD